MTTTCIRNVDWAVCWDESTKRHQYRRDIDIVFSGNAITHVGPDYRGPVDQVVDGRNVFAIPGLIDIHTHPTLEPIYKGVREDHGSPHMYCSGLYERSIAFRPDAEGQQAAAEVAYCELLMSGVTTVAELSSSYPGWIDRLARSGLRAYVAPGYASSRWAMDNAWELKFDWNEQAGRRRFEQALTLIAEAEAHPSGRLSGMIYPAQIDTCSEALLRDSMAVAREKKLPFTTHAAQSVVEFNVMVQRHGKTPIQWAQDIGLLGPGTILGHAIFIDEHSWLHWPARDDLRRLADSGTSVAHCPTPFARYGQTLEDLGRYMRAGVNMGIGTDTSPHNIIEEMRWAVVLGRVAAENLFSISTGDVFTAATIGGATALGRPDLGRIAPGMKADIVLVDLTRPEMLPARDPLRSLLYTAADRAVRDVYVDGVKVVENGKVLTLNHLDAVARLEEAQRRMLADTPSRDYAGRSADEVSPLSLPLA